MEPNARLLLDFKRKSSGETYIARQFFKLPLQIFPPYYPEDDGTAFVYLLNPSSGMLEGDLFEMRFTLQNGAGAVLTTPSSNKIYRSKGSETRQNIYAEVAEGCCLEYIPEHSVPYRDSRFRQCCEFRVERGGTLFAWDAVMPGRLARNECFDFAAYRSDISIYYDGKLKLREAAKIVPAELSPDNPAIMGDYKIFFTAYLVCETIPAELLGELREYLSGCKDLRGGASQPDDKLLVIKVLLKNTLNMGAVFADIWNIVRTRGIGKPAFKIRKY